MSLHPREHHSDKERKALTLATMWTDPENTVLIERSRHRTQSVIPLMGNIQNRQIHRQSGILVVRDQEGDC